MEQASHSQSSHTIISLRSQFTVRYIQLGLTLNYLSLCVCVCVYVRPSVRLFLTSQSFATQFHLLAGVIALRR